MDKKLLQLDSLLLELGSVLVAFSGGIDSTFLLWRSLLILGSDNVWAITAHSEVNSAKELKIASDVARHFEARHSIVETSELKNQEFLSNPTNRCFLCKNELYRTLQEAANDLKLKHIIDGSNLDDLMDFRPGFQANKMFGVRSPLLEAGLTKSEIRTAARLADIPNWNQPSNPCLCSRIPYSQPITSEKLRQIESAENLLEALGFKKFRVRHHGDSARIEIPLPDVERIFSPQNRDAILAHFRDIGFTFIAIDLQGLRSGSLNEVLKKGEKNE